MRELTVEQLQNLALFLERLNAATEDTGIEVQTGGVILETRDGSIVGDLARIPDEPGGGGWSYGVRHD